MGLRHRRRVPAATCAPTGATSYDWRAQEAALNDWPQLLVDVEGLDIHCIHVNGVGPDPLPLVLTHGWPSSFFEMHKVIGPLSDPARYGGDPADAFDVVVPSLPGYGWSSQPRTRGMSATRVAELWVGLMEQLGYDRFGAHGGDWGSAVSTALGAAFPDRLIGIHLTMLAPPVDEATLTPDERAWWQTVKAYRDPSGDTSICSGPSPRRRPFGLTDSPAGLAAWITEKWWRWSDCADDQGRRDLWRAWNATTCSRPDDLLGDQDHRLVDAHVLRDVLAGARPSPSRPGSTCPPAWPCSTR